MRGKAGVVLVALAGALACAGPSGAAGDDVSISVARTHIETSLGRKLGFQTTVVNDGSAQTAPLVAHMTVFSLRAGTYVDPEDWSSQRTYAERVNCLRPLLNMLTIYNDAGAKDRVYGQGDYDWFFTHVGDLLADRLRVESIA